MCMKVEGADGYEVKCLFKRVSFGRVGGLKNILKFRRHDGKGIISARFQMTFRIMVVSLSY